MSEETIIEVRIDWRRQLIPASFYAVFALFLLYKFNEVGGVWSSLMFWLGFVLVVGLVHHWIWEYARLRLTTDTFVWRQFSSSQRIPLSSITSLGLREGSLLPGDYLVVGYQKNGAHDEAVIPLRIFPKAGVELLLGELKRRRPNLVIPTM